MLSRRAVMALPCGLIGGLPVALGQPLELSFVLVNNSGRTIAELYATPSGVPRWGHDRLGSEAVPSGRTHRIRLPVDGHCAYDLRVVYQGGVVEDRRGIDICTLTRIVFGAGGGALPEKSARAGGGQGSDPSFSLVNRGARTINEIYASPSTIRTWGSDLLGSEVLPPGQTFAVRLPADGNCVFDVRVVFDDGRARERRRVNTCNVNSLRFP